MSMRVSAQCVANDYKQKIRRGDDQAHGKSDRSLAAVRGHTKRHTDDSEGDARERKRKSFVNFGAAGTALPFVFAFQLLQQLCDRQRGTAWSFLLFLVKFFQTDWQCAFNHVDPVAHLVEVKWVLRVALLVTRPIEMH